MKSSAMATNKPQPLYPKIVLDSSPDAQSNAINTTRSPPSLYPSIDMKDLVENLFPDSEEESNTHHQLPASAAAEETILRIPGAVLHLIDRQRSVHLAAGDFTLLRLRQGPNSIALLARVDDKESSVQWPLARDEPTVKLDASHYFFSLRLPGDDDGDGDGNDGDLNYGLTFASKGQERLLEDLDAILTSHTSFSVRKVAATAASELLDGSADREVSPAELDGPKRDMMEERSAAYWTTLAPNVEDYSGSAARAIAMGTGQLVRGILWCGDVTVDRLKWGDDMLRRRMGTNNDKAAEVSPQAMRRMKRVKRVTKMSEKVANGILSGVLKVSGFFTSSIVNSKAGKKFFGLLPGEIILASLDGFGKICDAVEVAGMNVLQTTSVVTTGVVSHRYGEQAGEITGEGLGAAGHAFGTAWAVFKIRKALNPKSVMKTTTLAKSAVKAAAAEMKAKQAK